MASRVVRSKPMGVPEFFFRWRPQRSPWVPKLLAVMLVAVAFGLLMALRVRVVAPERSAPRKASAIFLRDDAEGRAMSLRAKEGGPFPSKFRLSAWDGLAELEGRAMEAVRFQPQPYVSPMQDLPRENELRPLELAVKGQSFFPKRAPVAVAAPSPARLRLAPALYLLAGIPNETLPSALPAFEAPVDGSMAAASWRFLLRLNEEGDVTDCVSLEKGGEAGALKLEMWLRKIRFQRELGKPSRWIAVAVGFTNQPADGPHAR